MNVIPFAAGSCEKVRRHLDSYVSGELLVETTQEVLHHLESCGACRAMHDERVLVRNGVRRAVRSQEAPEDLMIRIRGGISEAGRTPFWLRHWKMMMVAATLFLAIGITAIWRLGHGEPLEDTLAGVAHFARAGLADHLHCTIGRKYPSGFPAKAELGLREQMAADWGPLEALASRLIPSRYALLLAHRCTAQKRRFVHLTYVDESAKRFLSVVVAAKSVGDETVPAGIQTDRSGAYSVAAFGGGEYVGWVVSDMAAEENRLVAAALQRPVSEFLARSHSEI